jgi:murein L,D-transpeptidase YcbB/YkuD
MHLAWVLWRCIGPLALACCFAAARATAAQSPLWFEAARPSAQAWQAVELLGGAGTHGLEPADYAAAAWRQALLRANNGPAPDEATVARLDTALTQAMLRYLADLHDGRIRPQQLHQSYSPVRREPFDAAVHLREALAQGRLPAAVRDAAPRLAQYERLREALARYRAMGAHAAWQTPLPPPPKGTRGRKGPLEPGWPWAGLGLLAERLQVLGDLARVPAETPLYEGPLVEAVKSFQQRHGLVADGRLGKATLAQLDVAPPARAHQLELALERLRWTPLTPEPRMVVINIPEFVLRAYEVQDGRVRMQAQMKVIVGRALDRRTPLFDADMRFVEFSPYWNVPPSIVRKELLPRLRRDPGYFGREGFEFVGAGGRVLTDLTPARLDALQAGQLRIRQRPGPRNALGQVKFVVPERREHLPAPHPVGGPLRTGPARLQPWLHPRRRPGGAGRLRAAGRAPGGPKRASGRRWRAANRRPWPLPRPVRVLIAYGTALVKDGRVHFFEDIYRQDRALDAALRALPRPPARGRLNPGMHAHATPRRRGFLRHGARLAAMAALPSLARATGPGAGRRELAPAHTHTREHIDLVYAFEQHYLPQALGTLNHFLRDHYTGEVGNIDPRLFDLLHRVRGMLGSQRPFEVISANRRRLADRPHLLALG